MCGFRNASLPGIGSSHLKKQIDYALTIKPPYLEEIEYISILGLGSFFDTREIPIDARNYILTCVSQINSIKKVQVESRLEYINTDNLKESHDIIENREFEVAIGIESSNEKIRNKILRKNLSWDELKKKFRLFKKTNTDFLAYILIKPPTLTEEDAVEDAVKSSHDIVLLAREAGINVNLALEPTFVMSGTPLEEEYLAGKYKPINLWSLLEIIRGIHDLCPVFIGCNNEGFVDNSYVLGIEACKVPTSCFFCRKILLDALQEFNRTQNINVFNELFCSFCQKGERD
jgi:radical SAM enzyme (TIGR01210 family)